MSYEYTEDFLNPENTTVTPYSEMETEKLVDFAKEGDVEALSELLDRGYSFKEKK